jgi:hypothetical protein
MSRTPASALAAVFASDAIPQIIAALELHGPLSISGLHTHVGVGKRALRNEVSRLHALGVVRRTPQGKKRVISLTTNPATANLVPLALLAYGPPFILAREFSELGECAELFLHGDWARRDTGILGELPVNIYVLLIGDADADIVFHAALRASRSLGREVITTIIARNPDNEMMVQEISNLAPGPLLPVPLTPGKAEPVSAPPRTRVAGRHKEHATQKPDDKAGARVRKPGARMPIKALASDK